MGLITTSPRPAPSTPPSNPRRKAPPTASASPGYNDPGSGLFIGYDSGGWFWQTYTGGGSGSWYSGARIAAPSANEEHDIQVSGPTDAKVATLTVDDQKAFDVDYRNDEPLQQACHRAGS